MKFSFCLKYIIGGAVAAFILRHFFNEKDMAFWMGMCITIVIMIAFDMLVRVFKNRQNKH